MMAFPILGEGSARIVYDLGDGRVVKVDKQPGIYGQSDREALLWRKYQAPWMAPVLESGPGWVMMPRAVAMIEDVYGRHTPRSIGSDEWYEAEAILTELADGLSGLVDIHPVNVGWFGDTWKMIDYGVEEIRA